MEEKNISSIWLPYTANKQHKEINVKMEEKKVTNIWSEWTVEEVIGRGGFGTVYRAVRQDNGFKSYAAIKEILIPQNLSEIDTLRSEGLDENASKTYLKNVVDEFVNEIQVMEQFKGIQNIVSVEDYKVVEKTEEIGWNIYIRMELLTPFSSYICDKKLTEQDVIQLGCDICTALEICSQKKVIHRDIKPENIFVNEYGSFKLGDFGISRKLETYSMAVSKKGTPYYMAPEVYKSEKYDARVDIYSLGIVLYRLLNGNRFPFWKTEQMLNPNERQETLNRRINGEELPVPSEASSAMANLILKACAYNPENRFSSATEMKEALLNVKAGTYQIEEQNFNKTVNVREKKQEVELNGKKNVEKNTFGRRRPKTPKIIAGALVAALLIGGGVITVPHIMDRFSEEVSQDQNENEEENKNASVTSSPSEEMKKPEKNTDNKTTVDGTKTETNEKNEDKEEKETADYSKGDEEKIASILTEAEQLAETEDYEGAVGKIQQGLVVYPKSAELQNQLEQYRALLAIKEKEETLSVAENYALNGDYLSAMTVIEKAQDEAPEDSDYATTYNKYFAEYKTSEVNIAIAKAEEVAGKGEYLEALRIVNQTMEKVGEEATLQTAATTYEDAYVKSVSAQVDKYLEEQNIASAKEVLEEASKELPNNTVLTERKEEVNSYKTVSLSTLVPINGEFKWNEGTPEDTLGSDYSNVGNYVITHHKGNHSYCHNAGINYAEYYVEGEYNFISFDIAPYYEFGEESQAYIQVYADNVLCYTSPVITRKTERKNVVIDIGKAEYIKIVVSRSEYACLLLSDVLLTKSANYVEADDKKVSLAVLPMFSGNMVWNTGYPITNIKDTYYETSNYAIIHGTADFRCYAGENVYVEYYIGGIYKTINFDIAPYADFDIKNEGASSVIKVYVDDKLKYTSPTITKKTKKFNTGDIDLTGADYLKIVVEKGEHGCVIISDVLLEPAQ